MKEASELKMVDAQLDIEIQQYARLVNSLAEAVFICDSRGVLQLVNPAMARLAGYDDGQALIGLQLTDLFSEMAQPEVWMNDAVEHGMADEVMLRRRDGHEVPISFTLSPVQPCCDGRYTLAGTAHDLTEIKRQQVELEKANAQIAADRQELTRLNSMLEQKVNEKTANLTLAYQQLEEQNRALQKLDRMKTDFVSMVSHELRAPLTNIGGGIELLLASPSGLGERPRQTLKLVQAEITRLARFVETILDLSALESGHMPIYPAPVSLPAVVAPLRMQLERLEKGNRLEWHIPEDLPYVSSDEQALTSILFHLLDNAQKYSPHGRIIITARAEQNEVNVSVEDEGPGISPEVIPLLFNRFYRANEEDSQDVYGYGLGLYTARRFLEAMNGRIRAENREEGGARFIFWLKVFDAKGGI
jgi:PAS domain S-box-containing protein